MTEEEKATPPDKQWAVEVCKIGQGTACCRFVTFRCKEARWSCQKNGQFRDLLNDRVAAGTIVARGDNCEGRAE